MQKCSHPNFFFKSKNFFRTIFSNSFSYIFFNCGMERRGKSVAKLAAPQRLPKGSKRQTTATCFSGECHASDYNRIRTELYLDSVGFTFEDIHAKVSDQGSIIKKAWGASSGGYYTAHTLKLAVKEYLEADGVANIVTKTKGITTYFHRSSDRRTRLSDLQKHLQVAFGSTSANWQ